MAPPDPKALYWPGPFRGLYQQLQAVNAASEPRLRELLTSREDWLLEGLPKFHAPSDDSRTAAKDAFKAGKLVLSAPAAGEKGAGQRVTLDGRMEEATLAMARIMDLDEVQTVLLLRRFAADTGTQLAPPKGAEGGADQVSLDAGRVVEVIDYYYSERLYLLKCLQFLAIAVEQDRSGPCASALGTLLSRGLALNVFGALTGNLSADSGGSGGGAAGGASAGAGALVVAGSRLGAPSAGAAAPHDLLQRRHLQLLHERCELLALMARLYELHSNGLASELTAGDKENATGGKGGSSSSKGGGRADALFAPDRFSTLVQSLRRAALQPRAAAGRGGGVGDSGPAAQLARLAECLAAVLVVAAMQPAHQIELLSQRRLTASPLSSKGRSVSTELSGLGGCPGAAVVLLSWAAFAKLVATESGIDELGYEEHLSRALQGGGFSAFTDLLSLPGLGPSTHPGMLCRRLLLQALCLVNSAFDLDPMRLDGAVLHQLTEAVVSVLDGCPGLVADVWDPSLLLTAPLRALLNQSCALFPAFPRPLLRLLAALASGRAGADEAYAYLAREPLLTVLHDQGQPGIRAAGAGSDAFFCDDLPWSLAPEVLGTTLPTGSRGKAIDLPAFLGPPGPGGPDRLLIQWDVQSDQGTGQVLLVARAAHCMRRVAEARAARASVAGSPEFEDLALILALMRTMLESDPLLARRLASVSIPYTQAEATVDWLGIFTAGVDLLPAAAEGLLHGEQAAAADAAAAAAAAAARAAAGRALGAAADCVACAAALAAHQPARVTSALARTRLLSPVTAAGGAAATPSPSAVEGIPIESLASTAAAVTSAVPGAAEAATPALDVRLPELQSLIRRLEAPTGDYPVTSALLRLTAGLLRGSGAAAAPGGPAAALVAFAMRDVLGCLGELPARAPAARWQLAALALRVTRLAVASGASGAAGAAPKAPGPPAGVVISPLAASVVQQMAFAGHGYLAAALPPPCAALKSVAEQRGGDGGGGAADDEALAAALDSTLELLQLAPVLLGTTAHFPCEVPLQQFWLAEPATGGPCPAALLAGFVTYGYDAAVSSAALAFVESLALALSPVATPSASRAPGAFAALLGACPGLARALVEPFRRDYAVALPEAFARAAGLLEAAVRYHPELLDAMCFPSALSPPASESSSAASAPGEKTDGSSGGAASAGALVPADEAKAKPPAASAGPKGPPPFSALDGLWSLLQNARALLQTSPRVVAAAMSVLSTLWECQATAHGAVELLRGQAGFWDALKACLPDPESLAAPQPSGPPDAEECEAAAWRTSAAASAMHVLLLELLSIPPATAAAAKDGAASDGGAAAAPAGAQQLLAAWGPAKLGRLLAAAAAPRLPVRLLESVLSLTQATYLQLGSVALKGAWGDAQHDALAAADAVRSEIAPLLAALARGEYDLADLESACHLLAGQAAAARAGGPPPPPPPGSPAAGGGGGRGAALAEALCREPLGRTLLGAAAVTPVSLTPAGTEYGRAFLFDPSQIDQLLGSFLVEDMGTAAALAVILGDLGAGASLSHARLALLQSAASMVASLPRDAAARRQLQAPGASNELLRSCVAAAEAATGEYQRLAASPAARLLLAPWATPVLGRASSEAVLLCCRTLLAAVRLWKATHARAAGAAAAGGGSGSAATGAAPAPAARPALLMRMGSSASRGSASMGRAAAAATAATTGKGGGSQSDADTPEAAAMGAAARVAALLSDWLRSRAADGPGRPASDWGRPDAAWAGDEVTQCLCTCLLLLLQETPEALGAVEDMGTSSSTGGAAGRSELQLALLDVLPMLCKAAAAAAAAGAGAAPPASLPSAVVSGAGGGFDAAAATAAGTHHAAVLQLLIELLQRQLPPSAWIPLVGAHLALVPTLQSTCCGAAAISTAALTAQGADVIRVSVLELLSAVASVPDGALQLFQQGGLPALLDAARDLLDPSGGGLLAPDAISAPPPPGGGGAGPGAAAAAAAAGGSGAPVPGTLGAYRGGGWAAPHQQWCVLLGLYSTLLRNLSRYVDVGDAAVALAVAIEPRLVVSLQLLLEQLPGAHRPSGGGDAATLQVQLACLLEAERSLALLCLFAGHSGAWQMARPGALAAFRAAAAGVVEFAARPSTERQLRVQCPPLTAFERRLSRVRADLDAGEGWVRACAAGAAAAAAAGPLPIRTGAAAAAAALTGGGGSSTALALTPTASGDAAAGGDGGGTGGSGSSGGCSEYVARLAEAVYSCADHALRFLALTSPQLDPREAAEAGPMWPKRAALVALQEQCIALAQAQLGGTAATASPRRRRLASAALRLVQGASPFLSALGGRAAGERLSDKAAALERALADAAGGR